MRTRLIAVVAALAMVAPVGLPAGAHEGGRQQLDRIESKLERTRSLLRQTNEEREGLLEDIAVSDRRREELSAKIHELSAKLEETEARLAEVQSSLDLARASLLRWNDRLQETRDQLFAQRETLGDRAAAAYKMGAAGLVDIMLGAQDFRALTDRVQFVRSVLDEDSYLLNSITAAREQVADQRDTIAGYEADLAEHRASVQEQVERIRELKAEQEALHAQVRAELAQREELLEGVEGTRRQYQQAVAELEAESARITALIQGGGSTGSPNPNAQLYYPAPGPITSGYGWRTHPIYGTRRFHAGVDIDADCGDPIWSGEDGTVLSAGWNGGYGQATVVDHGNGLSTLYAHQSALGVSTGQRVSRGQRIGTVGTTGWSTGCHLHFEVRINGNHTDPTPYIT